MLELQTGAIPLHDAPTATPVDTDVDVVGVAKVDELRPANRDLAFAASALLRCDEPELTRRSVDHARPLDEGRREVAELCPFDPTL
jgi:hypothetical protein